MLGSAGSAIVSTVAPTAPVSGANHAPITTTTSDPFADCDGVVILSNINAAEPIGRAETAIQTENKLRRTILTDMAPAGLC